MSSGETIREIVQILQKQLNCTQEWCIKWRIQINASKSAAIIFSKRKPQGPANLQIFNEDIPWESSVKYLGVHLDKRLNFKTNTEAIATKINKAIGMLYPLINRNSKMSLRNKTTIFKTMIRPILAYAAPSWAFASKANIKQLQILQNKFLRMIVDTKWYIRNVQIHKDLKIEMLEEYFKNQTLKWFLNSKDHPNPLISNAICYDTDEDLKYAKPKSFIKIST